MDTPRGYPSGSTDPVSPPPRIGCGVTSTSFDVGPGEREVRVLERRVHVGAGVHLGRIDHGASRLVPPSAAEHTVLLCCEAGGGPGRRLDGIGEPRPIVVVPGTLLVHPRGTTLGFALPPMRGRVVRLERSGGRVPVLAGAPGSERVDEPDDGLRSCADGCDVVAPAAAAIDALWRACGRPAAAVTPTIEALRARLVGHLVEARVRTPAYAGPAALGDVRLMRAVWYVEAHLGERLAVAALARVAGLSSHRFAHRFASLAGETPHRYVMRRRCERALDLLYRGDASLAEIAAACGFASQQHFTNRFAEAFGTTPGRWRMSLSSGQPRTDRRVQ